CVANASQHVSDRVGHHGYLASLSKSSLAAGAASLARFPPLGNSHFNLPGTPPAPLHTPPHPGSVVRPPAVSTALPFGRDRSARPKRLTNSTFSRPESGHRWPDS